LFLRLQTPDFFYGYIKDAVYVTPLFNTLPEFVGRIQAAAAAATVTPAVLTNRLDEPNLNTDMICAGLLEMPSFNIS
jgi:hypothetical protein